MLTASNTATTYARTVRNKLLFQLAGSYPASHIPPAVGDALLCASDSMVPLWIETLAQEGKRLPVVEITSTATRHRAESHIVANSLYRAIPMMEREWENRTVVAKRNIGHSVIDEFPVALISDKPAVVREFAAGNAGVRPGSNVVAMAGRIVQAAGAHTVEPEIVVDDDDGSLDFDLRLTNGLLVLANLFPDGRIDASVYDDRNRSSVRRINRMPRATESDLVGLLQS